MANTTEADVDWRCGKNINGSIVHLYKSKHLSDVLFKFGEKAPTLKAHKFVLAMRSAVFETMFFGPGAADVKDVTIDDIDPETFNYILSFIYTDQIVLDTRNVMRCLYGAKKYQLSGLVQLCTDFLENSICLDNACTIYEQAKFYELNQLETCSIEYIIEHADELFKSEDILRLSKENLMQIISNDHLTVNEKAVFDMVMRWVESYCSEIKAEPTPAKKREVAGELMFQIRFPLMTPEEFAFDIVPTGVISKDEQLMLYHFLITKSSPKPGKVGPFISTPRAATPLILDFDQAEVLKVVSYSDGFTICISSSENFKIQSFELKDLQLYPCDMLCYIECEGKSGKPDFFQSFCSNKGTSMVVKENYTFLANKKYFLRIQYPKDREFGFCQKSANSKIVISEIAFGSMNILTEEIFEGLSSIVIKRV